MSECLCQRDVYDTGNVEMVHMQKHVDIFCHHMVLWTPRPVKCQLLSIVYLLGIL